MYKEKYELLNALHLVHIKHNAKGLFKSKTSYQSTSAFFTSPFARDRADSDESERSKVFFTALRHEYNCESLIHVIGALAECLVR